MPLFRKRKDQDHGHETSFYTYPKLLFAWPLIVMGYALYPLGTTIWVSGES